MMQFIKTNVKVYLVFVYKKTKLIQVEKNKFSLINAKLSVSVA